MIHNKINFKVTYITFPPDFSFSKNIINNKTVRTNTKGLVILQVTQAARLIGQN